MAEIKKVVVVPTKTETVVDHFECELCDDGRADRSGTWAPAQWYDVNDTTIEIVVGTNFPEGSSTDTTILDICPECFWKKLIPWFESQGGTTRTWSV